jgi:hypothetical protein
VNSDRTIRGAIRKALSFMQLEAKVKNMAFVDSVIHAQTEIEPHSLNVVIEFIVKLKDAAFTTLYLGGKDGQMTMEFVHGLGYYVSAFGTGEIEEWLACDESLTREEVSANLSGQVNDVPRNILVSEKIALDVAAVFYRDGSRSSTQCWIRSLDLM